MLAELRQLFASTKAEASRDEYANAIIEMNCLGKATSATRRQSNQRLGELFALDTTVPLFRIFRRLWDLDKSGRELLALLCALARDPLLVVTAPAVLSLSPGAEFQRDAMSAAVREVVGTRMKESVLAKVIRNVASTWAQSGHLEGRIFKKRCRVTPTPSTVAFALYLGHAAGFRGMQLFTTGWMISLDCTPAAGQTLALEAKRVGLLDMRVAGDVIELGLDRLDPSNVRI